MADSAASDTVSLLRAILFLRKELLPKNFEPLTFFPSLRVLTLYASDKTDEARSLPGARLPAAEALAEVGAASWAVRYAAACYGGQGKAFFDLVAGGLASLPSMPFSLLRDRASAFAAVARVAPAAVRRCVGGRPGFPRSFLVLDEAARAVVIAIRGTLALADVATDACAYEVPFCGGRSHAGLAKAARSVWSVLEGDALALLRAHAGFALVLTGHSLGAGAATLLSILLNYERSVAEAQGRAAPLSGVAIAVYAFAAPPCFAPIAMLPATDSRATISPRCT